MNESEDIYADIREIKRRLENLETAPRVPQITTFLSGIQAQTATELTIEDYLSNDYTYAQDMPQFDLRISETGRLLIWLELEPIVDGDEDAALWVSFELMSDDPVRRLDASDNWAVWQYAVGGGAERRNRLWVFDGLEPGEYVASAVSRYPITKPSLALVMSCTLVALPL